MNNREIAKEIAREYDFEIDGRFQKTVEQILDRHYLDELERTSEETLGLWSSMLDSFKLGERSKEATLSDLDWTASVIFGAIYRDQPPTPITGPPDLKDVPDEALVVYKHASQSGPSLTTVGDINDLIWSYGYGDHIQWHIPLGVIESPEPELPRCKHCGSSTHTESDGPQTWWFHACDNDDCSWIGEMFKTEAEAIAAARKMCE